MSDVGVLRLARILASLSIALGVCVLLGWAIGDVELTQLSPGLVSMKPNAALCFVLAGIAVWSLTSSVSRRLGAAAAVVVVGIGSLTSLEYLSGTALHVDLLVRGLDLRGQAPRMAPASAAAFLLLGAALLARHRDALKVPQAGSFAAFTIGYLAVLGYLYGVSSLYQIRSYTSMALHTGIGIMVLSVAVLATDPDRGVVGLLRSRGGAGRILRWPLPLVIVGTTLLGWLRLKGQEQGWFDTKFGVSLLVVSSVILSVTWLVRAAIALRAVDLARDAAEEELARSNAILEDLVSARTRELALSEERLRLLVDGVTDYAIVMLDVDGVIVSWNSGAERIKGYTAQEAVGQHLSLFSTPEQLAVDHAGQELRLARSHGRYEEETWRVRKDGSRFWANVVVTAVHDAAGDLVGFAKIARDMTERRELEAAADHARDLAVAAARARQEFLANMSHEIRTPMNAVIGMTSILLDTNLDADQRDYVETVRSSGEHLLTVINDILDYSKLDAGKLVLERLPFSVRDWVHQTLDLVSHPAHDKNLELVCDVASDVPETLEGDPGRLRQVLLNLLSNAVKFTAEGEIEVTVSCDHLDETGAQIKVTVRDTGIGIDPVRLPALFDPFTQADSTTTRVYGGTGLGLAISRQIVERLGGSLVIESAPGAGTSASFTFHVAAYDRQPQDGPAQLAGLSVLIVDDNATNRLLLETWLSRAGTNPHAVNDSAAALEFVAANPDVDIAVLDLMMPGVDGVELGRRLRDLRPHIKLVLLSSGGPFVRDVAGLGVFDAQLSKPVKPGVLLDLMARLVSATQVPAVRGEVSTSAFELPARARGLTVLVVEDNPVNQRVARHLLGRFGLRADVAASGAEALSALELRDYDLVLMDVQMPEMDGLTATRQIRRRWPGRALRIVAMTANVAPEDVEGCRSAGMDGFLGKPINVAELADELARLVPAAAPAYAAFDPGALAHLCEQLGEVVVQELAVEFARDIEDTVVALRVACDDKDRSSLARTAHRSKSSSRTFGAAGLASGFELIEQRAADDDWLELLAMVGEIGDGAQAAVEAVLQALGA